jgi:hypothetical protein
VRQFLYISFDDNYLMFAFSNDKNKPRRFGTSSRQPWAARTTRAVGVGAMVCEASNFAPPTWEPWDKPVRGQFVFWSALSVHWNGCFVSTPIIENSEPNYRFGSEAEIQTAKHRLIPSLDDHDR